METVSEQLSKRS